MTATPFRGLNQSTGPLTQPAVEAEVSGIGLAELVLREVGMGALEFLTEHAQLESAETSVHFTQESFEIQRLPREDYVAVANLKRLNDIVAINRYLCTVNGKLRPGGLIVGCVETAALRADRLLKKFPPGIAQIYCGLDFVFKRAFPKIPILKRLYYWLTAGRNRVMTLTETLGRLYYCGFRLVAMREQGNLLYFCASKHAASVVEPEPSYGPVLKLKRFGHNELEISVYKIRTMHSYAEYLQEYVYEINNLKDGGKFKDDFRLSPLGRVLRRFWVDEIPMLWNVFRGDLKLVGVRPLSKHYLSLYPSEARARRRLYKPGLVPPFYADLPSSLEEIVRSETKYFDAYDKQPFLTDARYLLMAAKNIILGGARSG